jgi:HPt (histidine-containing phosphotransfer) domain-containing protein
MNSTVATPPSSVFNSDELLARCMGNASFAERVLDKFLHRCALDLAELVQAAESLDANAITATAHRIKGGAANVAARRLFERAALIEDLGRAARLDDVPLNIKFLQQDWTDFMQATTVRELGSCSGF